jgi:hypothetical protein
MNDPTTDMRRRRKPRGQAGIPAPQVHPRTARANKKSPRWALFQPFRVSKHGEPFLFRLRLLQTPWFSVLIHHIQQNDLDRAPHDHPWPFASLILRGSYRELLWEDPARFDYPRTRIRRRFSLRAVKLSQAHQITELHGEVWTLVVTGRHQGTWRFWTPVGPIDWREYDKAGDDSDGQPDQHGRKDR